MDTGFLITAQSQPDLQIKIHNSMKGMVCVSQKWGTCTISAEFQRRIDTEGH